MIRQNDFGHGYSKEGRHCLIPGKDNKHEDKDGLDYQIKVLLNTFDDELEKTFLKREFEKIGSFPEKEMFLDSLLAKSCE